MPAVGPAPPSRSTGTASGATRRSRRVGRSPASPCPAPYRDRTVFQLPPNTQGVAALQMLRILDGLDVMALGDGTVGYVHVLAEAARLAFEDRDRYVTDPDFLDIPLDRLLSAARAAA